MIGFPVEWLGPKCEVCGFRHEFGDPHVHLVTADELEVMREQWRAGIFPDKRAGS